MMNQQNDVTVDRVQQLMESGMLREALDLCRQLCQTADAQPEDWLLYGCLSGDIGQIDTARMALEKATELDADFVEAWFALGKLLVAAGDSESAVAPFEKAAQLQPDNADIWLTLGIACGLAKQIVKAEEYCRRSLALQAESAQARFNLANALQAQGKLDEAETEYEAALRIEPGLVEAWSMLAQARLGLNKFDAAEVAATRALALNPSMGEAHYTQGLIADELGDTERARDHFREAVKFLPDMPDAHWRLGQVLMKLKAYAEAAESFQAVLNAYPGLAKVHAAMGDSFYQRKLYGRAENCYRKAVALNNDDLGAHRGLAFSLKQMKRDDAYEQQLVECLRIDPNEQQAKHLLATIRGETTRSAPADYVAGVFDGYADNFDQHLVGALNYHVPEMLHELVGELVAPPASSLDIIDLGCGTGLCGPLFRDVARTLHGVDLSPRMIEKARERNLYDTLEVGDVAASLKAKDAAWDFAIATDVFVYIGDLQEVFTACFSALRPGGLFAFSVEGGDDCESYILRKTGRYAHAGSHIRTLAAASGFQEMACRSIIVRKEGLENLPGYLFLLRKTAGEPQ
ncbi:MAG: tetratricopeptide repeat protein [Gammaproteobacteria bacterium]|nr:tetratricopeptide repeat protein [Gammaproteobacteria bacterium]